MPERAEWTWERTDPNRSGSSGDIAKLFRHEQQKAPGILSRDAPSPAATLLAREVIQNSWDAARELQLALPNAPQFNIAFRFRRLHGTEKQALIESGDVRALAERVQELDRQQIGLRSADCLDNLDDPDAPMDVLQIVESGATGMYGPWQQDKSHMYLALVSLGYTKKLSGTGGSYGYGKAGLINGSRIRSVWAYTCFRPVPEEPHVSRRLLGMTYWGQHDYQAVSFTGFARFGESIGNDLAVVQPFENERADQIAMSLGMDPRDPNDPGQLGTTFLLLDAAVEPSDLVRAVERSWWPALVDSDFYVKVVDYDDTPLYARPKQDAVLRTFVDAWEIAKGMSNPNQPAERLSEITMPAAGLTPSRTLGMLGLVSDTAGWSYAEQPTPDAVDPIVQRSLVALTRAPKMVVEYLEAGQSPPFVRGTFIADAGVDLELLRTEPKAHDAWRSKSDDGELDPESANVASTILRKIKSTVNNHRQSLKPPVPKPDDVRLPEFNNLMQKILSGTAQGVTPPPVADARPVSILLDYEPHDAAQGRIQLSGTVKFSLSDQAEVEEALVDVGVAFRFLEEDRVAEFADVVLEQISGATFHAIDGRTFRGVLARQSQAVFRFETAPYDANWSGRLFASGVVLEPDSLVDAPS